MPKHLVRDGHGVPLLCTWDDCGQWGDDRIVITHGPKKVRYIFCSEGHRAYWTHSHVDLGNRATGDRGRPDVIIR